MTVYTRYLLEFQLEHLLMDIFHFTHIIIPGTHKLWISLVILVFFNHNYANLKKNTICKFC